MTDFTDKTPASATAVAAGKAIVSMLAIPPAPHVARYLARVDECLLELSSDTGRSYFLRDELAKWQGRYAAFQTSVDRGFGTSPDVTAWDYVETMAELDKRIAKYPVAA